MLTENAGDESLDARGIGRTVRAFVQACGYLCIFLPPVLLVAGAAIGWPALAVVSVFCVFPLVRIVFGDARHSDDGWPEWIARILQALPIFYLPAYIACAWLSYHQLLSSAPTAWSYVQYTLSLWIVGVLGLPPAHELGHRGSGLGLLVGNLTAGVIGYPLLSMEHAAHHATRETTERPEWPALHEPAWRFSARRALWVFKSASGFDHSVRARSGAHWIRGPLAISCLAWGVTAAVYSVAGGLAGLTMFVVVSAGVLLGMQLLSYVQHWGLAPEDLPSHRHGYGYAWEDTCAFQQRLTLSICYHEAHHRQPRTPYYQLQPVPGSPRQPAGYVVLLVLCLIPPLWRKYMVPAREAWLRSPLETNSPGHRVWCFQGNEREPIK